MTRRNFIRSLGVAAGAGLVSGGLACENEGSLAQSGEGSAKPSRNRCPAYPQDAEDLGFRGQRSILFLDYFPLVYHDNVAIHQATARYIPESYFVDPLVQLGYSQVTSQVFFDEKAGLWKRFAGRSDVYAYESEDAISWRISPVENMEPQKHPHHVFTSHSSALGSIMHDPNAQDGFQFKALCLGGANGEFNQASQNPASFFIEPPSDPVERRPSTVRSTQ